MVRGAVDERGWCLEAADARDGCYREIRRRTDVVGIFPDRNSVIRLVGSVLVEQHDEWAEGRRYLGLEVLKRSRIAVINTDQTKEAPEPMTPAALTA